MQATYKKQKGYLTIYLSLIFGVILSLLLALIEGAAIGASRLQAELVADLGMDSIFAEYNREVLSQYGLFFIDDSYGAKKGTVGNVRNHLANYMSYNMNPQKNLSFVGATNLLKLENPYLEIEEAAFATDNNGEVWKAQAVDYMKSKYGINLVKDISNQLVTVNSQNMLNRDITAEIENRKNEFNDYINGKEDIEETSIDRNQQSEEGFSFNGFTGCWDELKGRGVLDSVVDDKSSISGKKVNLQEYVYSASKIGAVNKGTGLPAYVDKPDGITDELLYGEYLMTKCGNYLDKKDTGRLNYEIEYILFGKESDMFNLRECCERLVAMRMVSNFIFLHSDDGKFKKEEAYTISAIICALCMVPELTDVLTEMILGIWAYAESILDVKCLLQGGKVSLLKDKNEWNLGLIELISMKSFWSKSGKSSNKVTALSYQGYLRVFLATMNKETKLMRSLDIVEMNIRETEGNRYFRIDQCIDFLKVNFGFRDTRKNEFVFTRMMRYE